MRIAIIGAGMAGLACAERLSGGGHTVTLYDKGRRAGGRMSTRTIATSHGEAAFDHGAQYFTARDPAFQARVAQWQDEGVVAPWPVAGSDAWVGTPAIRTPVQAMADRQDVRWSHHIERLSRQSGDWRVFDESFDAAIVAVAGEQAAALLDTCDAPVREMADRARASPSLPCWTVMAAFAAPLPGPDILREAGVIGWAARNSAKPGRSGPESWVIQAGPDWSRTHLEDDPAAVVTALLDAFGQLLDTHLPPTLTATAHRWRYARSGAGGEGLLWNPEQLLGVCGDWLLGPRVECAWLSGTRLAAAVADPQG